MSEVDSFLTSEDFRKNKIKNQIISEIRKKENKKQLIKKIILITLFTMALVFIPAIIERLIWGGWSYDCTKKRINCRELDGSQN